MLIEELSINNKFYPKQLKEIYNPPKKLYVLGNKEILNYFSVAIVGTRKNSKYGETVATNLSYDLASKNIVIVSGLALGIDSFAHIGALNAKGKTVAVLGHGLDIIYPKENRNLARKIIQEGGCLVTEYPIGTQIEKEHFPERNRIISGLSRGVVVIEATEKSGSLITADFAVEQGRDVFAVPGEILSQNSFGTNELIKQGAKLITEASDILEEYKI